MNTKNDAGRAASQLREFINPGQLRTVLGLCAGEEGQWFIDKLVELAGIVESMPTTYEQEGKGEEAIAYLHYFDGGQASWYITEKDAEAPGSPGQHQAFGLADLYDDGGELGYISIVKLLEIGAELDLYWRPKTLAEIRAKRLATV